MDLDKETESGKRTLALLSDQRFSTKVFKLNTDNITSDSKSNFKESSHDYKVSLVFL